MIDLDDTSSSLPTANGPAGVQSDIAAMLGLGGAASPAGSTAKQKSAIEDILGLFDSTPAVTPASPPASQPSQPTASSSSSLFEVASAAPPAPAPAPAQPRLTSYTAYEQHGLKITLTPQISTAKPGLVNILARFQTIGSTAVTGINFQAAVPRVCFSYVPLCIRFALIGY